MSLLSDLQLAYALARMESARSAWGYLQHVVINSDPEPKKFADLAEPWQWDRARYVLPAVEFVTGHNPGYRGPRNLFETMPRGHDKTSFIGRLMNWVLVFSKRKLRLLVAAKDSEQANLLKDFMRMEADLNPWFGRQLTFHQKIVSGPGGTLRIASADALGLFGQNIDIFVLEELTHWEDVLGKKVWTAIWSGRQKRPSSVALILSNAGYIDTWQHKVYAKAKKSATTTRRWHVFEAPGILAGWMDKDAIAEDRLMLPPIEAVRLLDNKWVDPGAVSGYLTRAEIQACIDEAKRRNLQYADSLDPQHEYFLSIDYGPRKDRTVLVLGHQLITLELVVDRLWVLEGKNFSQELPDPDRPGFTTTQHEVPVAAIREIIDGVWAAAPNLWLIVDPHQLKELIQDYRAHLPVEEFEARGGKSNHEMAETLRHQIIHKRLLWYPGAGDIQVGSAEGEIVDGLMDELPRLVLKQMSYGYRFDHLSGRHDDRAVGLGMMCVAAFNRPRPFQWVRQPVVPQTQKEAPDPFKARGGQSDRELWGVTTGRG